MIVVEAGFAGTTYPLTNPRIAAYPVTGTVTVSTEATGFAGTNANNELTWTWWKPTAVPATWQLSFTSTSISYCAIAAHNIGTTGGTVQLQTWDGAAWNTIANNTPTDDGPIVFLITARTIDRIRVRIANAIPTIGVIWFGPVTELPQKAQWTGSRPFNEALTSVYTETVSDGGHVLDRFATRKAGACAMEVQNVSETWAAANIPALQAHMGSLPVFMADRPSAYPKSVVYGSQQEPLQPSRVKVLGAARVLNFNIIANQPT